MLLELTVQDCYPASSPERPSAKLWKAWFGQWLEVLNPAASVPNLAQCPSHTYELTLRLTDDREIQHLNQQFRHKNQPTDVLAFAALEVDSPVLAAMAADEPVCLGDIIISIETATQQAQEQGHALETELAWLASHGLLHLLGWDHPDAVSLDQMLQQQCVLLQVIGVISKNSP
jgi:probable rRNA maturation factor